MKSLFGDHSLWRYVRISLDTGERALEIVSSTCCSLDSSERMEYQLRTHLQQIGLYVAVGPLLDWQLLLEGPAHYGWCHHWANWLGGYKKESWGSRYVNFRSLILSLSPIKYSHPVSSSALAQPTWSSFPFLFATISSGSHRSCPPNFPISTHCFISAPNSSRHSLKTHRSFQSGKQED